MVKCGVVEHVVNHPNVAVIHEINEQDGLSFIAMEYVPGRTLKQLAMERGTYFQSQAALDSYLTANGGSVPGGIVLYADFARVVGRR